MKQFTLLLLCCYACQVTAQDLTGLDTVAYYSLINTAQDLSGQQADIELMNAPFDGANGVFSNGIYVNDTIPGGSLVHTPHLTGLYDSTFAVQVEFQVDSFRSTHPVLMCGDSWRYLGLIYDFEGSLITVLSSIWEDVAGVQLETGRWYTFTLMYSVKSAMAEYWLDGQLIATRMGELDRPDTDGNVSNTHFGAGLTFSGYLRNLIVLSDRSVISAVKETREINRYAIYPNPASSYLQIENAEEIGQWVIYNLEGKICEAGKILDHDGVDISNLQDGVYFLTTMGAQGTLVSRFIKQGLR